MRPLLLLLLCAAASGWDYQLLPHQRRRSVSYVGGGDALRALVTRLNGGEAVTVAVLGGSISRGHGAAHDASDRRLGHPGSWSRVAFDALKSRWPATHQYANGAVPATGSAHFVTCLRYHLASNASLILLDFSVNDGKDALGSVEGIVRRVRHQVKEGPGPVLMFVNWAHSWPGEPGKRESWTPEPPETEAMIESVAGYYDLPTVSMRRALLADDLRSTPGSSYADFAADDHHPNARGHRLMGEAVFSLLEKVAAELEAGVAGEGERAGSWLPPPMVKGNLPEFEQPTCHFGADLAELVLTNDGGWEFFESAEKPGFIAERAGSVLELRVGRSERILTLSFLKSVLAGTGGAQVTCITGCECEPQDIDARSGGGGMGGNIMIQHKWFVTASADCSLRIKNVELPALSGGGPAGARFKVMGLSAKITEGSTLGDMMDETELGAQFHRGGGWSAHAGPAPVR